MKINQNQLGTLLIVGVVLSVTAACGGSPIKPTATGPAFGDGASAPSVNLTAPRLAQVPCDVQPAPDPYNEDAGNVQSPVMCDAPVTTDDAAGADAPASTDEAAGTEAPASAESQGEVAVDNTTPTDNARFVR